MKEPFWAKNNKERWKQLKFNTHTLTEIKECHGSLHCEYCNEQDLIIYQWYEKASRVNAATADHFYPKSEYPHLAMEKKNMVVACMKCNEKKDNSEPDLADIRYPRSIEVITDLMSLI